MQGMAFEKQEFESHSGFLSFFWTGHYESDVLFLFCFCFFFSIRQKSLRLI